MTFSNATRVTDFGHRTRPAFQSRTDEPSNPPTFPVRSPTAEFTASASEFEL